MSDKPPEGFWNSFLGTVTKIGGAVVAVASAVAAIVQLVGPGSDDRTPPPSPSITRSQESVLPSSITLPPDVCGGLIPREAVITLSRTSGPPGTALTISGSGFAAGEQVEIEFHATSLRKVRADAGGSFSSIDIQVPSDWKFKGQFDIRASGGTCLNTVSEAFQVT